MSQNQTPSTTHTSLSTLSLHDFYLIAKSVSGNKNNMVNVMREGAEIRMKEFNLDRIEIARAAALTVSDPKTHSMLRGIKNQCGVEVMKTLTPESSAVVLFGITIRDHAIKSESLGNFLTAVSIRNEDIAKIYAKEASAA